MYAYIKIRGSPWILVLPIRNILHFSNVEQVTKNSVVLSLMRFKKFHNLLIVKTADLLERNRVTRLQLPLETLKKIRNKRWEREARCPNDIWSGETATIVTNRRQNASRVIGFTKLSLRGREQIGLGDIYKLYFARGTGLLYFRTAVARRFCYLFTAIAL